MFAGESKQEVENSPFSEQLLEKGYEIIYFTDPVDEYVMQNLLEYDDMKFQSASTGDLTLGDKDTKKENKKLKVSNYSTSCIPQHLLMCALWEQVYHLAYMHVGHGNRAAAESLQACSIILV